jgi:hypothetical protein
MLFVGIKILTAVLMKMYIPWDIMPCCRLKANRYFGGTCRLYLQSRKISQVAGRACLLPASRLLLSWLILQPSVDFQRTTQRYISKVRILHWPF